MSMLRFRRQRSICRCSRVLRAVRAARAPDPRACSHKHWDALTVAISPGTLGSISNDVDIIVEAVFRSLTNLLSLRGARRPRPLIVFVGEQALFRNIVRCVTPIRPWEIPPDARGCYLGEGTMLVEAEPLDSCLLAHELAHAYVDVLRIAHRAALWAHEGLACLVETTQLPAAQHIDHLYAACCLAETLTYAPLAGTLQRPIRRVSWYALAECFVRYLLRLKDMRLKSARPLIRLFRSRKIGAPSLRSLAIAVGFNRCEELELDFYNSLQNPYALDVLSR